MIDEIFGKLEHKYNFYKYENINLFNEDCKIKIVVENDENNTILAIQQNKYKKYWNSTAKDGYKWEDNPYVFVYEFERIENKDLESLK